MITSELVLVRRESRFRCRKQTCSCEKHRTWNTAVGLFLPSWVIRMGIMRVSLAMCWTWLLLNSGTKAGLTLQKRWLCTLPLCGIILGVFVIIVTARSDQDHLIYLGPLARISRQAGGRQGYMVGLTLLILHGANFRETGERVNLQHGCEFIGHGAILGGQQWWWRSMYQ